MTKLKYEATLIKIYTDGEGKIYNFAELDIAMEALFDSASNDLILNAYVVNNVTGEIVGFEDVGI